MKEGRGKREGNMKRTEQGTLYGTQTGSTTHGNFFSTKKKIQKGTPWDLEKT